MASDTAHLLKAVGFGGLRYGVPLLPVIAILVGIWATLVKGPQAAFGAVMGFFTALVSQPYVSDYDRKMRHHWSRYRGDSDEQ